MWHVRNWCAGVLALSLAAGCTGDGGAPDVSGDMAQRGDPPDLSQADMRPALPPGWRIETIGATLDMYDIRATGPGDVYIAASNSTILHSTGDGKWVAQPKGLPSAPSGRFNAIFAPSKNAIFALYNELPANPKAGQVFRSSGNGTWSQEFDFKMPLLAIWGPDANTVYAAGSTSTGLLSIFKRTSPGKWQQEVGPPGVGPAAAGTFNAVWGPDAKSIYAAGKDGLEHGLIYHSTGDRMWAPQTLPDGVGEVADLWGPGPAQLYAVGAAGLILRSTGDGNWAVAQSGTSRDCLGIWGAAQGDIYVLFMDGLLRASGDSFTRMDIGLGALHRTGVSIWGSGPKDIYVTTSDQLILHYRP